MAPITQASDESNHQALLDELDIHGTPKPFRNPSWRPAQRRNKNVKQIIADVSRKEASVLASQNNSGTSTPAIQSTGGNTPINGASLHPNIAQAAQSLDRLVLERNLAAATGASSIPNGPTVTYTNIESAPSFHPSSQKRYCDITGLPAPYTHPKSRLRYHNMEVFSMIQSMGQGTTELHLAARGAHTVLK
jgi:INO80 complex subunit C